MAGEWRETTLGNVIELKRGYDLPQQKRSKGVVPLVSSSGVTDFHSEAMVKGPGVVTGRYGTLGQVFFVKEDFWPLNTTLYVRDFKDNDPRFISYFLRGLDFQAYSDKGAVPGLNRNHLHQAEVRIPSDVSEQCAIAHILGTLDDKIELNRRMNETLEAIARAIFKSWFVDFDPVRAKASGEPPESTCRRLGLTPELLGLFPGRLVDSELGEIPEGWRVSTLGEYIEIFDSKRVPLSSLEREQRKGDYPYYGAASLMDYVDDYIFEGIHILMGEDGSVVNPDGTPVTQYVWGKFWVNNHAHVLKGKIPMTNEHLYVLLGSLNIASFVTGAVQAKLSQANLRRIPVIGAAAFVVEAYGAMIAPLFNLKRARDEEMATLTALRDSLLPKLITGELKVDAVGVV